MGCGGGDMGEALKYIAGRGVTYDAKYKYKANGQPCLINDWDYVFKIKGYKQVKTDDQDQLVAAISNIPVSVGIGANNIRLYKNGVYNNWDCAGGCIPSVIAGDTSQEYSVDDNKCSIDMDEEGYDGEEICKYDSVKLQNFQNKLIDCWGSDSTDIPSSMLDNFCMPKILHERVSVTEQEILKNQCNVTRTNLR